MKYPAWEPQRESYLIMKGLKKKKKNKTVRVKEKENVVACDKKLLNFWTHNVSQVNFVVSESKTPSAIYKWGFF